MKVIISLALLLAASAVKAADFRDLSADDIRNSGTVQVPAAAAPEKARSYQNVFMQIRNDPSWGAVEANDYQLKVDISVRRSFAGQYDMYNRVDNQTQMGTISRTLGTDWQLSGYGAYLDMREFGGSYTITGSVPGEGGQSRYININVSKRFDDVSFYLSGIGMNLNIDRYSVNGYYDPDQYSKQAFTAVLSMIFAAQAENSQPAGR